jgi:hypothetical protein
MNLDELHVTALKMLFNKTINIENFLSESIIVKYEFTGVGFTSIIRIRQPLPNSSMSTMQTYAFDHPSFPDGGVFNCTTISSEELELEGVTLGGANWPMNIDCSLFIRIS